MAHADHTRDPCPYVILNDFGGAFAMGAIGGTVWHGIKGSRNSPRVSIVAKSLRAGERQQALGVQMERLG